jgi:hydroxymethylglutaryl-CoA synthase
MEEAALNKLDLADGKILAVGYGSGDAAEAIPMTVVPGWEQAAARIGFRRSLESSQDLTRAQYESLHDSGQAEGLLEPDDGFIIDSIGNNSNRFSDEGIEYYRFLN